MHFHGYLWVGDKAVFDKESLRRPPPADEPPATCPPDVIQRYREAVAQWRTTDVPPLQTAHLLLKPAKAIRGTWNDPAQAAQWVSGQLAHYTRHINSSHNRHAVTSAYAAETLARGDDVSFGFYLGRPLFLSIAVVTCSPNRSAPELHCPA
ncbi:hypothetical protein [Streptomyces orinoci]|uniref:Uncharacterized protein n=1 Tax=Streptomyces orinoci TaxID=67339 RepID=A0ABV3JQA6_STRON|nr:hypothetical protein [Streptomyces orinoci]